MVEFPWLITSTFIFQEQWVSAPVPLPLWRARPWDWHCFVLPGKFMEHERPGPCLSIKTVFPKKCILIKMIRRSNDRLILIMRIPILMRQYVYIETAPMFWVKHLIYVCGRRNIYLVSSFRFIMNDIIILDKITSSWLIRSKTINYAFKYLYIDLEILLFQTLFINLYMYAYTGIGIAHCYYNDLMDRLIDHAYSVFLFW